MSPLVRVGLLCLLGFGRVGADMVAVNAHGDIIPMPPDSENRRSFVREVAPKQSSSGTGQLSHAISEPDLHESLAAFAKLQQPATSLLAAQSMLAEDCKTSGSHDCDYQLQPAPPGPDDTKVNLCTGETVVDFSASRVAHNNLGGSGPDAGPEHIRYASVATVQDKRLRRSKTLDLLVSTNEPGYSSAFSASNGLQGGVGTIGMPSGKNIDLKFQFVDTNSDTPAIVESFTFAFLDFDEWVNKKERECIKMFGFDSYEVASGTELNIPAKKLGRNIYKKAYKHLGGMKGEFCSSSFGSRFDNPTNPMNLTAKQAKRAVMFKFSSTSEFAVTLQVKKDSECPFGRVFMFAGAACLKDGEPLR